MTLTPRFSYSMCTITLRELFDVAASVDKGSHVHVWNAYEAFELRNGQASAARDVYERGLMAAQSRTGVYHHTSRITACSPLASIHSPVMNAWQHVWVSVSIDNCITPPHGQEDRTVRTTVCWCVMSPRVSRA